MNKLFSNAASLLLGEAPEPGAIHDARLLLRELGYGLPDGAESDREARHRACLLAAASQFIRMFELAAPDAPGLIAFGAEFDPAIADSLHAGGPPVGVSGTGQTMQEAFQGCVGEGIEYLSQLQHAGDALVQADAEAATAALDGPAREQVAALQSRARGALTWHRARRLSDDREVLLPADLCLRRPRAAQDFVPPFPLSTGSAAGISWDAAALHGLFELIERDAASLWWRGGSRGRAVPSDVDADAHALLQALRAGAAAPRRSWLLDITTDIGVPAVAALSCGPDGLGLAFGLAARRTLLAAARSAVLELCQIELAEALVEAKGRERGEDALNERDRAHLQRATAINTDTCALLHPVSGKVRHLSIDGSYPQDALRQVVQRLAACGIATYALDLTRSHFAIPVARIMAPGLQAEPSTIATSRLSGMIAQTGGGAAHTGGIPLI